MVRAYAKEWNIDPNKIGIMGFSAGAELAAPAAVLFEDFDKKNNDPAIRWPASRRGRISSGIIYPGPTPFAPQPHRAADSAQRSAGVHRAGGSGDRGHAVWAIEYFPAMLAAGIPNIEMHIYGNGRHPGDRMTGGLTDRNGIPFGTWQYRFIDWFRDLGFLQKPGVETKAAKDIAAFLSQPSPRMPGAPENVQLSAEPRAFSEIV